MAQIIYVLTNEAMPDYAKIGKTKDLQRRMKELYRTSVPLPFECAYAAIVGDAGFVEKQLHDAFADYRVVSNREFFRIDPERVVSAIKLAEIKNITPGGDFSENEEDLRAINKAKERRAAFNFSMVNIPVGSELVFSRNHDLKALVEDNKYISFNGETTSLSASALTILHDMGYEWTKVAGPDYWMFEGETLSERRRRLEEEG